MWALSQRREPLWLWKDGKSLTAGATNGVIPVFSRCRKGQPEAGEKSELLAKNGDRSDTVRLRMGFTHTIIESCTLVEWSVACDAISPSSRFRFDRRNRPLGR